MTTEEKLVSDVQRLTAKLLTDIRKLVEEASGNEVRSATRSLKEARESREVWKERANRYRKQLLQAMKDHE